MQALNAFLHDFTRLFDDMAIPYVIIGGFAVRVHAIPRPTYDLDFTINIQAQQSEAVFQAIEELGFQIPDEYRAGWTDAVGDVRWSLFAAKTFLDGNAIVVDIFIADNDFLLSVLQRRELCEYNNRAYWFATPEDLILLKLCGDRPRDWIDIADVLFTQGQLDEAYMKHWAERLGVSDRLEKIWTLPPNYGG